MSQQSKTVLVVEDERPLAEVIKKKFETSGFEVVTSRSAEQAKSYLEEGVCPDAIWVDHYLIGKEDGLALLSWLKEEKDGPWRDIPVFIVSNTASAEKVQTYLELGVDKYYTKSQHRLGQIIEEIEERLKSNNA